ncbi:nucleolar protein [Microbotryomycetes sp. JL221]|nr:nucleolar protein [Microbotryomycetes sp. JL221]
MPKTTPTSASSQNKKRVRIDNSSTTAVTADVDTTLKRKNSKPVHSSNKTTTTDSINTKSSNQTKSKMGIELMDLRDKAKDLNKVEKFKSKDSPKPTKSAIKLDSPHNNKKRSITTDDQDESDDDDADEQGDNDKIEFGDQDDDDDSDDDSLDFLQGFEESDDDQDDGQDSSDEEELQDDHESKPKFNKNDLPQVKGKDNVVQTKLENANNKADKKKKKAQTGTVYLGRIPHGFFEDEMRSYFSQFGEVTRLRLSRNKQTGRSKHYAFIEFAYESVAKIVQETMDNYLLAGHILVCKVVPNDQIHPKMWIGANRKYRPVPKGRRDAVKRNAPKTEQQQENIKKRLLNKEQQKRKQLAELGIEYDFAGYAGKATSEGAAKGQVEQQDGKKAKGGKVVGKVQEKSVKSTKKSEQPAKKKARKST